VINAGGVLIHTNLGRAPLSRAAVERIAHTACGYCNLEYELDEGRRGSRDQHAQRLFATLFERQDLPGTATLVVNNNAAAVLLALAALARAGQVIVSRGELVEIGGSFRIPEIMEQSGALLREVGSTNRTRVADYEQAIGESTRLLLRVHRSNFEMIGFTEQPSLAELVELGARRGLPVMEDLGSGSLVKMAAFGIPDEPSVADSLRAGAALVTYSGDKLLGGPQAGLITGRPELVARLRSHPLFRALRVDKLTYAALEATLVSYLREAYDELPLLRMMRLTPASIRARCEALAAAVGAVEADGSSAAPRLHVEVVATECMIGGGSAPGRSLPSHAVALTAAGIGAA
jgi:L-seryl-tRNA(Ser) seleniumtransferase